MTSFFSEKKTIRFPNGGSRGEIPDIKIFSWNARSLYMGGRDNCKIDFLRKHLDRYDVFCVQETHILESEENVIRGLFPGFSFYFNSNKNNRAGGTLTSLKNSSFLNTNVQKVAVREASSLGIKKREIFKDFLGFYFDFILIF